MTIGGAIDVSELAALLVSDASRVRLVDSRFNLGDLDAGRRAYEAGHLPGAVFADLEGALSGAIVKGKTGRHPLPEEQDLADRLSAWGIEEQTLVVAYDDGSSMFAPRLWWLLHWLGHPRVVVLLGGVAAWVAAGHPLTQEPPNVARTAFFARPDTALVASAEEVFSVATGQARAVLLDARAPARYRGEQEPIDPVAGHIPTALNLPFTTLLDRGGVPRSRAEVEQLIAGALGDRGRDPVIAYCGSGVTACALIWAMQTVDPSPSVRLYPGSWSEWVTSPSRPVATGDE